MADHRNPWMPDNVPAGYQQALSLDLQFNPASSDDPSFLDGLMYNPLTGQGHIEGYARLSAEDFKPQADVSGGGQSSWIRGGERMQYEGQGNGGSGNLTFLHQQQLQPLNRPEASAATGLGAADSAPRSQDDEVSVARREMKSNREKLLRDRMNDHFAELAGVLDPGRPPKNDKASILNDGVNVVKKLRDEIAKLQGEHKLLMDESKELTAEKNELREERLQVKAEKEALERRLQGMLSWVNFNPSLMMAALASGTQPPPLDSSPAPPPPAGEPPQQRDPPQSYPNAPSSAAPLNGNAQSGGAQGAARGAQNRAGGLHELAQASKGKDEAHAGGQAGVTDRGAASPSGGVELARQQGGGFGGNQASWPVHSTERQSPAPAAETADLEKGSRRGGTLHHPTRPHAAHFRPAMPPPVHQTAGGLRNLQPKPDKPAANPIPEQAWQPCPPSGRPGAPRQQRKVAQMPSSGSRHPPPPQQNVRPPPTAAPSQPGTTRTGRESGRDLGGQPASRHPEIAGTETGEPRAARSGHAAASEQPIAAPPAERNAAQTATNRRSASPAPAQQPAEAPPPLQQAHPYPPAFAPMPYMSGFPGMMGMHPYSYPPQMSIPTNAATPPPENSQHPPPAPFPYHGYAYGQPGNPPGYPYPMFPAGPHPLAYAPYGFAPPYGAPGMGVFTPPPQGAQPPQTEAPRTANVQRPSAKVAQVQLPETDGAAEGGQGGNARSEEATLEKRAQVAETSATREAGRREEPLEERQRTRGDTQEANERPRSADAQAAKRIRVENSSEMPAQPLDSRVEAESRASAAPYQAQEPSSVTPGNNLHQSESSPRRDDSATTGLQSSPLVMGSQMSNCSSSSSGSRCGDVWTQGFQSALELPENDPTIRPPAA